MQEIDLSKLSIDDLQKYVNILNTIDLINGKGSEDFYSKAMDKLTDMYCNFEPKTIGDMKSK
jgi:hypothetical protein